MVSTPYPDEIELLAQGRRRRERRRLLVAYGFLMPSFVFFIVFLIIPLIAVVYLSFTNYNIVTAPQWVGLENYARLLQDPLFWRGLRNSFIYLVVTPILIVLSIWLAIVVNRKLRGIFIFRTIYYIPAVTSVVAIGMIFEIVFAEPSGLINGVLLALGVIQSPINFLTHPDSTLISVMLVTIWRGIDFYMVIFLASWRRCRLCLKSFTKRLPLMAPIAFSSICTSQCRASALRSSSWRSSRPSQRSKSLRKFL
jgi:ABC-type sugar transport system permease subunit